MINWSIQTKNIKDLKKYAKNPRKLTKEQFKQIKSSIDKFGLIEKPIINLDNTIISGHQRIEILKKDKIKTIECWVPDEQLHPDHEAELCLRMNRNHGEFDYDILANEFEVPQLIDYGFTIEELQLGDIEDLASPEPKEKAAKLCPHCQMEL
jgi:ParB-like chromosome segregation protein Spo0J